VSTSTDSSLDRVLGLLPAANERFRALYEKLWDGVALSPATIELCRLRIAMLMDCVVETRLRTPAARDAGLTEEKITSLASYASSTSFTPLERTCIAFVEQYVMDPHALTDGDFVALRETLDERQIATLVLAAATFDALMRMRLALDDGERRKR
jgi:alkylhydroperoxidase family enzyme